MTKRRQMHLHGLSNHISLLLLATVKTILIPIVQLHLFITKAGLSCSSDRLPRYYHHQPYYVTLNLVEREERTVGFKVINPTCVKLMFGFL